MSFKKDLNNIHDKSYKDLFSTNDAFLSFVNTFIQGDWVDKLEKDKLILVDKSYILSDYEELESDIVYNATIGEDNIIFYVLLELQSSVDHSMPIRLLMYMVELWREVLRNNEKKEIKRKSYRLPAIVPIVLYNGTKKWTCARNFKDIINESQLFGDNILDFKYILVDINRYSKEYLYEFKNIAAAIFLLDQDINAMEFLERLKNIVINFNNLTSEEKLLLKGWIKNTTNSNEIYNMNELVENIFTENKKEEVEIMVSNASNIFDKLKSDGIKEGKKEGKTELLITQLKKRFNGLSDYYRDKIRSLPENVIDQIATDIFDLEKIEDIKKYL
ncbi:Rpn family recombination-promoting nuclease/putative transposase [Clostridium estertheticum]|uniref:Rpn family recombination-promoting nuclease/putative transposase n=1 Tax=Clostridium estertheticum TaxID=238834 RepID=UPI001C7DCFD2|nr:Rpn family recombination-promoting nuclease/putative transposase [Clostridium estertheticum]MBX4264446.1 Rpn family recombination-promoting nuclease/putative transposase [Clostridium estertheticum]WLC89288.1 Rpn family recombination-promoting nuclease/putative transposase [Clostridium estertheticum]